MRHLQDIYLGRILTRMQNDSWVTFVCSKMKISGFDLKFWDMFSCFDIFADGFVQGSVVIDHLWVDSTAQIISCVRDLLNRKFLNQHPESPEEIIFLSKQANTQFSSSNFLNKSETVVNQSYHFSSENFHRRNYWSSLHVPFPFNNHKI